LYCYHQIMNVIIHGVFKHDSLSTENQQYRRLSRLLQIKD